MTRRAPIAVLIAVLTIQPGCGNGTQEPQEGVVLTLIAYQQFNTVEEILDVTREFEILLDAEDGFEGVAPDTTDINGFEVDDYDGDGVPELLLRVDADQDGQLPRGWIQAGSNADKKIAVRVRGLDENGVPCATGSISHQRMFTPGELVEKTISITLLSSHLAPRIVAVTPKEAPTMGGLGGIAFYASKPLDAATLVGRVHVYEVGKENRPWDADLVGPLSCPFGTEMWKVEPIECHDQFFNEGIGLTLDPGITDMYGRELAGDGGLPGYSTVIGGSVLQLFGNCPIPLTCYEADIIPVAPDVYCDQGTGRFEPTPCSIIPTGCNVPLDAFAWAPADNQATCQGYWEHASHHDSGCILGIDTNEQCGGGTCDTDSQACVAGDCFWRMGGCEPSCRIFGCPEFSQVCTQTGLGGYACQ